MKQNCWATNGYQHNNFTLDLPEHVYLIFHNTLDFPALSMTQHTPNDTIDSLLGLKPGMTTYAVRHEREKVVLATQGSEQGLFDPELAGLTVEERLLAALLACALTPASELLNEYKSRLEKNGSPSTLIDSVSRAELNNIQPARLKSILTFTHTLITDPVRADKQALLALQQDGLSTPEIVTLAQLIAFVSYQVRLAAGLKAMKALEQKA